MTRHSQVKTPVKIGLACHIMAGRNLHGGAIKQIANCESEMQTAGCESETQVAEAEQIAEANCKSKLQNQFADCKMQIAKANSRSETQIAKAKSQCVFDCTTNLVKPAS